MLACAAAAPGPAHAQLAGPLVQIIDADERDDHTNVAIEFSCSVRYVANIPASRGSSTVIQLRLGPDCGSGAAAIPERPLVGGSSALNITARLESAGLDNVALTLGWGKELNFVLAPTSDGRGLRLRLLRAGRGAIAKVGVNEAPEAPEGYAVNLQSSRQPIDAAAVQAAATALQSNAYVSELDIDDTHWYRLRVGPFTSRKEAERVLHVAMQQYPRAWIGINDETNTGVLAVPKSAVPTAAAGPTDPPISDADRKKLLREAQGAIKQRKFQQAIELLTKLLRQPEYPDRQMAQELLGLTQQRAGHLALAKVAYEDYLARYPDGVAAPRIRNRLRTLASAGRGARSAGDFGGGDRELGWSKSGTASMLYQGGRDHVEVGGTATDLTSVNVLLTDADLLVRHRGFRYDFTTRVSGGYTHQLGGAASGGSTGSAGSGRVSAAYAEFADRQAGLSARVGRQSHAGNGILGIFDGAFVSWQWKPSVTLNVAGGMPADTARSGVNTDRQFLALSADFGPYRQAWDFGVFAVAQQVAGNADRRALGFETRYFVPGRTAVLLMDYDFQFQAINSAILMGNWALPGRWILAFDVDHRRSPVLTLRNALIGQPVTDFNALEALFTPTEIEQLAQDRTPVTDALSLSLTRPLTDRWQLMIDAFGMRTGASPESGGVAATPSTGLDKSLQLQLVGSSLMRASDLHFFGARVQQSSSQRSAMLMWNARFPIVGAWRLGPRLRVERRESDATQSTQMLYLPEIRIDWSNQRSIFEFNAGGEIGKQDLPADTQNTRRLYFLLGYRLRF
ncbi:MAG: SPOR domain-containing protein [Steroidobacteraceae bacterium]